MTVLSADARTVQRRLVQDVLGPGLWAVAVLAWGVGDLATTHYALAFVPNAFEAHPSARAVIEAAGVMGHAVFKAFWLSLAYLYYRWLPAFANEYLDLDATLVRWLLLAVPAGFAIGGTWLTLTNLDVILG